LVASACRDGFAGVGAATGAEGFGECPAQALVVGLQLLDALGGEVEAALE